MRQGQQNRRGRGRNNNRKGGGHHHNPLSRSFESNGPDVKIRGTPAHIAEKYIALARDAQSSGDPVLAENYLQHAEHYNRIVNANNERVAEAARERAERERLEDLEEEEAETEAAAAPAPEAASKPASNRRRKTVPLEDDVSVDEDDDERSQPAA